ncbi:MAG: hypothetical protein B7Z15_02510 [Rhizobiales bacterium 32-66-8]|nr:MAG: hypothetical protein B7Z15_02510 [Rhizobiales bacterium 32-66-8]
MLIPRLISEGQESEFDVIPGWWAVTEDGAPVSGPYPTEAAAMIAIGARGQDQPTGRPGESGPDPE